MAAEKKQKICGEANGDEMEKVIRLPKMTEYAHQLLGEILTEGDMAIDATCGNGHDTLFLAQRVGENGRIYAFDIQERAIRNTSERLERAGVRERVITILDSHAKMKEHISEEAKAIIFNLGYLPGGDKQVTTKAETTLAALKVSLELLQKGGLLLVVLYPGHEEGKVESDLLLSWAKGLESERYKVLRVDYLNLNNDPPYILAIYRVN
jgi:tRNA G37 N-methylase Trm5